VKIHHFAPGQPPALLTELASMPQAGYVWIDLLRSEAQGWEDWPKRLLGADINHQHVSDALTPDHGPFFDGTADYDMLLFEGLGPRDNPFPLETRTAAFFVFERLLLTVRSEDNLGLCQAMDKLAAAKSRLPANPLRLAHYVLDAMIGRYLGVRAQLDQRLTSMQDELLAENDPMDDWRALLEGRRVMRRLEALSTAQGEALAAWRRGSVLDWDSAADVDFRDLTGHVDRVRVHAYGLERDLEAAVQLYFAITGNRANEIMKIFTVVAVVFMPMTLLTGVWGMNFKNMPELEWPIGYFLALGLIVSVGVGTFWWFRRRKFF
jgi:magnesium transporter